MTELLVRPPALLPVVLLAIAAPLGVWADATPFAERASTPHGIDGTDCNNNGVPDDLETEVVFDEHPVTTSADSVRKVYVADIDGDGDPDLVAASNNDDTVAWYPNTDGAGTFGTPNVLDAFLDGARSIAVADIDGDGDLDVAAGGPDRIGWFRNQDGAGSFSSFLGVFFTEMNPTWIIAEDLDGDTDVDLAITDLENDTGAWFENTDGLGTFSAPNYFGVGLDGPVSLAAGDIDGDLDLDLAMTSRFDNQVNWFENTDGAGTFSPPQPVSAAILGPNTVVLEDIDGDLDLDILVAHEVGDEVAWYENTDGLGFFGPAQPITTALNNPRMAVASDLDADGDLDVMVASNFDDLVTWYENLDGGGTFGSAETVDPFLDGSSWVVTADLDADGDPDAVGASDLMDTIVWYENESNDCNNNDVPDECDLSSGFSTDCDGNGRLDECDLAEGTAEDCNANNELDACDVVNGTSADCTSNGIPDECEPDCNDNAEADSCDVATGTSDDCDGNLVPDECDPDCDGDGIPDPCDLGGGADAACPNDIPDECEPDCNANSVPDECDITGGTSSDCNANGVPDDCEVAPEDDCNANGVPDDCETEETFSQDDLATDQGGPRWVTSADLDGDGDLDLISVAEGGNPSPPSSVDWFENLGGGVFSSRIPIPSASAVPWSVAAGDLDGDGDPDLLMTHACCVNEVAWYENRLDVDGTFGPPQTLASITNAISAVIADVDGDGDLDAMAAGLSTDQVLWWENQDGQGTFGPNQLVTVEAASPWQVVTGDIDGDSDPDVLSASFDNKLAWYANGGDGTFGSQQIISTELDGPRSVATGDIDGDGDLDAVAAAFNGDAVYWFRNEGGGTFTSRPPISLTTDGAIHVQVGDVDGDGDRDVVAVATDGDRIEWYENLDGHGDFAPGVSIATLNQANSLNVADLDGDGSLDVAVTAFFPPRVSWFRNLHNDCDGNGVPDSCQLPLGDCDSNGILDSCELAVGSSTDCSGNGILDVCEPDCNANGRADSCDLDSGTAVDCDGNGSPDECDTTCVVGCDADGDDCIDDLDSSPGDAFVCADTDGDGCDDCSGGTFSPAGDGTDADADGFCDAADCDPSNGAVWQSPAAVSDLRVIDAGTALLTWTEPPVGTTVPKYDTVRSPSGSDFVTPGACLATDASSTSTADATLPPEGQVLFYLVRVENLCPGGGGAVGTDSAGQPRSVTACPP